MSSIGIDIGGTSIKSVLLETDGTVVLGREVPRAATAEGMISQVADLADSLRSPETRAVGIGIAGLVRWPDGVFVWGPHVDGTNLAAGEQLEDLVGLPIVVDNDANCAAVAELTRGAAVGSSDAVVLTIGTGIGAGIIANGAVYRGRSFAGEAGHMTMVPDGLPCECGRRGCWETLVSGRRFEQDARRIVEDDPNGVVARLASGEEPNGRHLGLAAAEGDVASRESIFAAGRWLGRGVANLVALLDPELILVGGAVTAVGDILLSAARDETRRAVEGADHRPPVRIEPASTGSVAGAIGAAILAENSRDVIHDGQIASGHEQSPG